MRQLDWYLEKGMYGGWRADCYYGGFYRISTYDGYGVTYHGRRKILSIGNLATLDEAKAAAQADMACRMALADSQRLAG
jgi:hypothetical protein